MALLTHDVDETAKRSEEPRGLATGKTAFKVASGLIVRPSFNLYFLMYAQIARVTSAEFRRPQSTAMAGEAEI